MYGVSFRSAMDSARDLVGAPQANSRVQATATSPVAPKKKSSVKKAVFGTVIGAAVVAAGLALGNKFKLFDKLIGMKNANPAKFMDKVKNYAGVGAEKMNQAGEWILSKSVKAFNWVKGKIPFLNKK